MSKTKIEAILKSAFTPTYLNVHDDSARHAGHAGAAQGGHYALEIASNAFNGKTRLESHRMIYQALEPLKHTIHALQIKVR